MVFVIDLLEISYTLSSDPRVFTDPSDLNSGSSIMKELTMIGEDTQHCENHTMYLQVSWAASCNNVRLIIKHYDE